MTKKPDLLSERVSSQSTFRWQKKRLFHKNPDYFFNSRLGKKLGISLKDNFDILEDCLSDLQKLFPVEEFSFVLINSVARFVTTPEQDGMMQLPNDIDADMGHWQLEKTIQRLFSQAKSLDLSCTLGDIEIGSSSGHILYNHNRHPLDDREEIALHVQACIKNDRRLQGGIRMSRTMNHYPVEVYFNFPGIGLTQIGQRDDDFNTIGKSTSLLDFGSGRYLRTINRKQNSQLCVVNFMKEFRPLTAGLSSKSLKFASRLIKLGQDIPELTIDSLISYINYVHSWYKLHFRVQKNISLSATKILPKGDLHSVYLFPDSNAVDPYLINAFGDSFPKKIEYLQTLLTKYQSECRKHTSVAQRTEYTTEHMQDVLFTLNRKLRTGYLTQKQISGLHELRQKTYANRKKRLDLFAFWVMTYCLLGENV